MSVLSINILRRISCFSLRLSCVQLRNKSKNYGFNFQIFYTNCLNSLNSQKPKRNRSECESKLITKFENPQDLWRKLSLLIMFQLLIGWCKENKKQENWLANRNRGICKQSLSLWSSFSTSFLNLFNFHLWALSRLSSIQQTATKIERSWTSKRRPNWNQKQSKVKLIKFPTAAFLIRKVGFKY